MNFPTLERLEMPILQELAATGGSEDVRFLYSRLISYFPQLDVGEISNGKFERWRLHVQRTGRELDDQGLITRERGFWTLTGRGRERVLAETTEFELTQAEIRGQSDEPTHREIQNILVEIATILGFYGEIEFEYYDVVWRTNARAQRLSHVFEVQHKGNLDSAFAKLKKAYEFQRSKPFLILASERDTNRALRSISLEQSGAFHELAEVLVILSFQQIQQLHRSLKASADILPFFLAK